MCKKVIAKIFRVLTVPPILVSAMLTLIFFMRDTAFRGTLDYLVAVVCLALIPALAYPLQPIIPGFRGKGRDGQRALAFVTSAVGYIIGFLYALISRASDEFKFIVTSYLLSVVLLLIFNKILLTIFSILALKIINGRLKDFCRIIIIKYQLFLPNP